MNDRPKCRGCGGRLTPEDAAEDGLCSAQDDAGLENKRNCFWSFVWWCRRTKALEVRSHREGTKVIWSRPEVQVAFDQWLELGRPSA